MTLAPLTRPAAAIALLAALSAASGCKQLNPGSGAKSVDGLLNQDALSRDKRECGPGAPLPADAPAEAHLEKVHAALPSKLKTWFRDVKTSYALTEDDKECGEFFRGRAEDNPLWRGKVINVQSCWLQKPRAVALEDDKGQSVTVTRAVPVVHLTRDPRTIHRNLLPMTVYAFTEFYVDQFMGPAVDESDAESTKDNAEERSLRRFIKTFRKARQTLTEAFVDELAANPKLTPILGNYTDFYKTDAKGLKANGMFQNFVIAEFVDAYYCSPASRAEFVEKGLPRTKSAFAYFVRAFGTPWLAK